MTDDHNIPVTEDELHAYVDNELPAERRAAVESWIAAHPDDAARVASWRAMSDALHAKYDSVADEPVPTRLSVDRLSRTPRRWMTGAIAASLLMFAAGGGARWMARGASATPSVFANFTGDALEAHRLYVVEVRHPVEVAGNDRAHLQQWLTKRCGYEVKAPELDDRTEAGRRSPAARPHRTCRISDVRDRLGRTLHDLCIARGDGDHADALCQQWQQRRAILGRSRCRLRSERHH